MTTLYIALDDELLVARGRDGAWKTDTQLVGLSPRCLAVDPFQPERVYCGSSGHTLWRSADAGSSWSVAGEGIDYPDVTAVAVSPLERTGECGALYAGTEPSALFRSEDGGGTWRELRAMRSLPSAPTWSFPPRPHTNHVRWITPDVADADTLYVGIEAGALVRSLDGGDTWMDRVPDGPVDTHTLIMHPRVPGRLYAAAGDGFGTPGRGYNESRDGGRTWERPDEGLAHHYLWSVAVDPGDADTVVVSAAHSPGAAHDPRHAESTVYRRSGRNPWRQAREGLPDTLGTTIAVLAANQSEPGVFYAASNRGLYRSTDAGITWEQLAVKWPERYHNQRVGALVVTDDGSA
jgi:photosystem II stability/assembly factor-like uncharacterized protein